MTETDAEVPDENGLTGVQRQTWRRFYGAISDMIMLAVLDAPTPREARRRLALIKLDVRIVDAALPTDATATDPTATIERTTRHG